MLQCESHVSRGPILLLGNSICHRSRFAECSHKSRKKEEYNSSYSELGPPLFIYMTSNYFPWETEVLRVKFMRKMFFMSFRKYCRGIVSMSY